ncbi:hypothetical protein [Bowdeniella nasicola]|uniref:hypothetical protein n=1 Tax=Bowdeniella nasicola TaxID=208480 RepID=UPI00115F9C32|nr:hypothetical protein [Bowdeniella nasicola]
MTTTIGTPPDGWTPLPGWQPPSDWEPAPEGWEFWIDDTNPDHPDTAAQSSQEEVAPAEAEPKARRFSPLTLGLAALLAISVTGNIAQAAMGGAPTEEKTAPAPTAMSQAKATASPTPTKSAEQLEAERKEKEPKEEEERQRRAEEEKKAA